LFERLQLVGLPVYLLDVQYRMGPLLASFPNEAFYSKRLRDGPNVTSANYYPAYIRSPACQSSLAPLSAPPLLSPFVFFDLVTSKDMISGSQSRYAIPI